MTQKRLTTLFVALLLLAIGFFLNIPNLLQTFAEKQGRLTTASQISVSLAPQKNTQIISTPTPSPTVDGISLPPNFSDTDPGHPNNPNAPIEPEARATSVIYPPVPLPSVNVSTVPELDAIIFTNFRQLELPSNHTSFYGQVAWSSDSRYFLGTYNGTMDGLGLDVYHLYLGNVESGKFSLWSSNGVWPVWSRSDQYIYYLVPRKDGSRFTVAENLTRPYYDLYRRHLDMETEELLLKDIEPPGVPGAQLAELADGRILKFTSSYQLTLLPAASELAKSTLQVVSGTPLITLEELTGKLSPLGTVYSPLPPSFSVSRSGRMAVVTSPGNPALLLNLATFSKIATIDGLEMATNGAWSLDDCSFAYTNRQGIARYDVTTGETHTLVTNTSLGFRADDPWSGIGLPVWVLDGKALLFTAQSADWVKPGTESRVEPFVLSVTRNGSAIRPIGYYGLESVSPDGRHAIIRQPDPKTGALTTGETSLWLVDIQTKENRDDL